MKTNEEYRKEIIKVTKKYKGRFKLVDFLEKNGINRGNYYSFINGKNDNALSYEKLDKILVELQKLDESKSNKEMINSMNVEQFANFIEKNIIDNPKRSQIDIKAWLKANSPEIIYKDKNER